MTATLTIRMSDEVLGAIKANKSLTINLGGGAKASAPAARPPKAARGGKGKRSSGPREGSHGAKLVAWAAKRGKPFGTPEVVKALKINRGHASMVLASVVAGGQVVRQGRGVYALRG